MRRQNWFGTLEKSDLFGVFLTFSTRLVAISDDVFILSVGELEDENIASLREVCADSADISVELLLSVYQTKIIRKLAHFKSLIEQKLAELCRLCSVLLAIDRQ